MRSRETMLRSFPGVTGEVLSFVSILFVVVIGCLFYAGGKIFLAAYVPVDRCQMFLVVDIRSRQIVGVCSGLKYVHDVADALEACVHSRGTSRYKPFLPVLFLQVHDSTASSEGKFGITSVFDDRTQIMHYDIVNQRRM